MRVGDDLLGDVVEATICRSAHLDRETIRVYVPEVVTKIALLLVKKGLAVGEQQLHVARLRAIYGGVVDLIQRAVREGAPHTTGGRVRGYDRVFLARRPARLNARRSKGWSLVLKPAIGELRIIHPFKVLPRTAGSTRHRVKS